MIFLFFLSGIHHHLRNIFETLFKHPTGISKSKYAIPNSCGMLCCTCHTCWILNSISMIWCFRDGCVMCFCVTPRQTGIPCTGILEGCHLFKLFQSTPWIDCFCDVDATQLATHIAESIAVVIVSHLPKPGVFFLKFSNVRLFPAFHIAVVLFCLVYRFALNQQLVHHPSYMQLADQSDYLFFPVPK